MKKYLVIPTVAIMALGSTSCNNEPEGNHELSYTYNFELSSGEFTDTGMWIYTDDSNVQNLAFEPFLQLAHSCILDADGIVQWNGFVPVAGNETGDFGADWSKHLWSSCAGGGAQMTADYLLAKWDHTESTTTVPKLPSLAMGNGVNGATQSMYISNSNYVYHVMTSPEFNLQDADYLRLVIRSVDEKGKVSDTQTYTLAENGVVKKTWELVQINAPFGGGLYIQMEASRNFGGGTGQIPPYFCIDNYSVFYKY